MKKLKKNNKGFSLVELIVVVLIMAILAVALAPQVIKWVNKSKQANDNQVLDSLKSTAQITLTNTAALTALDAAPGDKIYIVCNSTSTKVYTSVSGGAQGGEITTGNAFYDAFVSNSSEALTNIKSKTATALTVTVDYNSGSPKVSTSGSVDIE